jgi:hypothetical protein
MVSGIYSVVFESNQRRTGSGIIVMDGQRCHGGDENYIYRGKFRNNEDTLQATVEVSNFTGQLESVMGPYDSYSLSLTGDETPYGFQLSGHIEGRPSDVITIIGNKIGDLLP